jgi:ATPase subunit of ABC transporter with duplicated ATPase domains
VRKSWNSTFRRTASGDLVIAAENISKAYGDRLLIENMSFILPPGGIVGVIAPTAPAKRPCLE